MYDFNFFESVEVKKETTNFVATFVNAVTFLLIGLVAITLGVNGYQYLSAKGRHDKAVSDDQEIMDESVELREKIAEYDLKINSRLMLETAKREMSETDVVSTALLTKIFVYLPETVQLEDISISKEDVTLLAVSDTISQGADYQYALRNAPEGPIFYGLAIAGFSWLEEESDFVRQSREDTAAENRYTFDMMIAIKPALLK